jgi:hypothetical protein
MSPVKWYLFKRKNGVWYVGYLQDGRKRWKSARCTVKVEALRKIANSPELVRPPACTEVPCIVYGRISAARSGFIPSEHRPNLSVGT